MDLRLPNITGRTEREQLDEIRSYLYYLANALSFSLSDTNTADTSQKEHTGIPSGMEAQNLFNAIKGLIIRSDAIYHEFVSRYESEASEPWQTVGVAASGEGCYCRYRVFQNRIYIEFLCHANEETVIVNADAIPYLPDREIVFVCADDAGFSRASLNTDGFITVYGGTGAVYGRVSYFTERSTT